MPLLELLSLRLTLERFSQTWPGLRSLAVRLLTGGEERGKTQEFCRWAPVLC